MFVVAGKTGEEICRVVAAKGLVISELALISSNIEDDFLDELRGVESAPDPVDPERAVRSSAHRRSLLHRPVSAALLPGGSDRRLRTPSATH